MNTQNQDSHFLNSPSEFYPAEPMKSQKIVEAQKQIQAGLERSQIILIYSLLQVIFISHPAFIEIPEYSKLLITHHPRRWEGMALS